MELVIPKTATKLSENEMMYLEGGIVGTIMVGSALVGVFWAGWSIGRNLGGK